MSLLFCDGFDHYVLGDVFKKWTSGNAPTSIAAARSGSGAYYYFHLQTIKSLGVNAATLIVGMAIKRSNSSFANTTADGFLTLYDGSTKQIYLRHGGNGSIAVTRGDGTQLAVSADNVFSPSDYAFVEFKATINNSTGSYEVRVNDVTILSGSGVDTQNSANAYANAVGICATIENSGGAMTAIDDFYVCDSSGSVNNDFLGDVVIESVFPNADGTNSSFTLSTGTSHYAVIDEAAQNGDTDYAYSATLNARETVNLGNISVVGGVVKGVVVHACARKDGSDTRGVKPVVKSGATYSLGAELNLSSGYNLASHVYELDPNTSTAWTETTVNAIEAGVDVST